MLVARSTAHDPPDDQFARFSFIANNSNNLHKTRFILCRLTDILLTA